MYFIVKNSRSLKEAFDYYTDRPKFFFIYFFPSSQTKKKYSRKRYCDRNQRWENPDRAKNQSHCRIRYRARLEKK